MMPSDASIGLISSHHYVPVVTDEATQAAKHVSDQGNQHNNGPHQDQIFDNSLCSLRSTVVQKSDSLGAGGGVGGGRE